MSEAGIAIPSGERTEVKVDHGDGTISFAGEAKIDLDELPVALEVTRCENAVVLAVGVHRPDPLGELVAICSTPTVDTPSLLVMAAVGSLGDNVFVARAFGQFDDAIVGVEVFATDEVLDRVESRLAKYM